MIEIAGGVVLDEREVAFDFIRASGPGGQNVNKVETAVQLRFDARNSPSLPDDVRDRLERLVGRRLTRDGVIVIAAQRFRSQEANRRDALDRLVALIAAAAVRPKTRRPTKPTRAARKRRLDEKARRGALKRDRQARPLD